MTQTPAYLLMVLLAASRQKQGKGWWHLHLARLEFLVQNNVNFEFVVGHFAQLLLFEGSVLTGGPAEDATWMRGGPIS